MLVDPDTFFTLFPRPLSTAEKTRATALLEEAESILVDAFARRHRSLPLDIETVPWLAGEASRVIREMVSAVMIVGTDAGRISGSVTAGQVSESGTWADPGATSWGQLVLTDAQKTRLGLAADGTSQGYFPSPPRYPERKAR
ncbi:hypothetical protein BJF89_00990 [Corynebacterium sp. CNJ-954]|uniref:Gp19/Gp15/Gp42 family protein n=1 Tax=Corynebacterium sp. CNJ-954 TaxID=1904962 RepID=UPI00095A3328|nr:Gp19/Gp15/Gp42 family protein [Corynebacterium sp. CNJ-954]OLT54839.1 hypothetical protein BJF89_00990 [Corynebacterium sp. CNJ-954]